MLLAARKNALSAMIAIAGLAAGVVSLHAQASSAASQFSALRAGSTPVAARITQPVDDSALVTLKGNTHPLASARNDQGVAPSSLPAGRLLLVLKRSAQQEASLTQYLQDLQTPGSANYHKYLTPAQFGALYGPADADILTVSTWLQTHGLAAAKVNEARTAIEFSGTVGQVQDAFHAPIHTYLVNGEKHYANASDPQIPAALAPVVSGVTRMNNFRAKSQAVHGPRGVYNPDSRTFVPELTGSTSTGPFLYVGPADAATIYDSPNASLNAAATGTTYDGTGVKIGVVGDSNIDPSSVALYKSFFGLPANPVNIVVDGQDPGVGDIYNSDSGEALLDVEIAGALAPGAQVNLYVSAGSALQAGIDLASLRAIDDNVVSVLNLSFGECEAFLGTSGNNFYYSEWEEAAAQGIAVTVSTGDSGSAGCDNPNTAMTAQNGLQVSGLASTPYNIAVGGTDFDVLATNSSTFSSYVASSNPANYGTAKKYIPENPWDNSTNANGAISGNTPVLDTSGNPNIVAAGGGQSSCVQSTSSAQQITCAGGWPKPSWQKFFDTGDGVRDLPDVSLFASNGFDRAVWAICATGTENGNPVNDCQVQNGKITSITGFGGTSTAAPAFAGVLAIVTQKTGSRLGQANQVLYPLAKQFPAVFHDVTAGNISVPCAGGSPDCGTNGFLTGYAAGTGYDLATGLGSVDISALAANWSSVTLAPSTTALTLNGSTTPLAVAHGTPVAVAVHVTGNPAPTGDVSLVESLNTSGNNAAITQLSTTGPLTLTSGAISTTINSLPGGTYSVVAHYAGDGADAPSDSNPVPVVVTPEASKVNVTVTAYDPSGNAVASSSIPYGYFEVIDATPVGTTSATDGNATGTVTFTAGGGLNNSAKLNSQGFSEVVTETLPAGSDTITAAYSGDPSFNASNGTAAVTVTQGITATSASTSAATVASNATFTMTAVVNTTSLGVPPTGTVTFKLGSTTLATANVTGAAATSTTLDTATASAPIAASLLVVGANTVTAAYSGDGNYAASTSVAVNVTVTGGGGTTPGFTIGSPNITVPHGATSGNTATLTITPTNGYTGTVDLTCAVTTTPSGAQDTPGCSVSPSVVVGSAPVAATLTITSTASSALHLPGKSPFGAPFGWEAAGGTALACVVLLGIPARRRGWRAMLALAVFAVLASFAGGCGGGSTSGGGTTHSAGTTTGAYTVTVTGTDSANTAIKTAQVITVTIT